MRNGAVQGISPADIPVLIMMYEMSAAKSRYTTAPVQCSGSAAVAKEARATAQESRPQRAKRWFVRRTSRRTVSHNGGGTSRSPPWYRSSANVAMRRQFRRARSSVTAVTAVTVRDG